MIFHENRLPADDSREIPCLMLFLKKPQNLRLLSAANYRWRFNCDCLLSYLQTVRYRRICCILEASSADRVETDKIAPHRPV